ncbi:hypothetical protein [Streptomyces sp. NPDC005262]|uniref:hypothetical protein n=1 Tax=Streptomyces sp. NPDC005262 TaxID=3364710 RepID=UPI00368A56F5
MGVASCGEDGRADDTGVVVEDRDLAVAQVAKGGLGQREEFGGSRRPFDDELVVFVRCRVLLVQDHHTTGDLGYDSGLTSCEGQPEGGDALELRH